MKYLKKLPLVCVLILPLLPLCGYNEKSGKHIEADLDITLGTALSYEASDFPGIAGFELSNADIKLSGSYDDNLEYCLSLDLTDLNSEDDGAELNNAYLRYEFSDPLRIRVGQSKLPFGVEYDMSSTVRAQLYHSLGSDLIAPGRALGITFSGKKILNGFSYEAGIYNFTSSDESGENDSGHFRAAGLIEYGLGDWTATYEVSASTAETFAQGIGILWEHDFSEDKELAVLIELLEQRYYDYYWNNSLYACISYRSNRVEPYLYFDYFDEDIGNDGENDILRPGLGFNTYLMKDKLQIRTDLHTEYIFSYPTTSNYKFYNSQLTVQCQITL